MEDKKKYEHPKCFLPEKGNPYPLCMSKKEMMSDRDIELEIEEIAMKIEELSAKADGMLYNDILKRVADCLECHL